MVLKISLMNGEDEEILQKQEHIFKKNAIFILYKLTQTAIDPYQRYTGDWFQ